MTAMLAILTGVVAACVGAMLLGRGTGRAAEAPTSSPDSVRRELVDLRDELAAGELSSRDYEFLRDRLAARMALRCPHAARERVANRRLWPFGGLVAALVIVATLIPALRDRSPGGFATGNDFSERGATRSGIAAWRAAERAVESGDLQRAVSRYRVAVAFLSGEPRLRARFGFALAQADRTAEAEEQLRLALRAQPRLADARLYLGAVMLARGRRKEAARQWRTYLALRPRGRDAQLVRRTVRRLR